MDNVVSAADEANYDIATVHAKETHYTATPSAYGYCTNCTYAYAYQGWAYDTRIPDWFGDEWALEIDNALARDDLQRTLQLPSQRG